MSSSIAARSRKGQLPIDDPALQNTLVARFGLKLMKQGFTALPTLVQRYYRYVPGNPVPKEVIDVETGEVKVVEVISYMTPTEFTVMVAIWNSWWSNQCDPWPGVAKLQGMLDKSERQLRRYLQRLRDKGFMLSIEQYNAEGKQISNRYDFSPFLKRLIKFLEEQEQPTEPQQTPLEDVKNGRERMSKMAGRGCQKWQGIEDESDTDPSDADISDSSGSAANTEGMATTIRNSGKETEETNSTNPIESTKSVSTEKEMSGAGHAKEANDVTDSMKVTPFERTAMRAGLPLELVGEMQAWLQACPRPERTPLFIEGTMTSFSLQMNNISYLASNLTQAAKLYRYAQSKGFEENDFRVWLHDAEKRTRSDRVENKMAYFFVALKIELLHAVHGCQWPGARVENGTSFVNESSDHEAAAQQPGSSEGEGKENREEPEEEYTINTEDPADGWPYDGAVHRADRLREFFGGSSYWDYRVVPTCCPGRYGFHLVERKTGKWWEYITADQIEAELRANRDISNSD